MAGLLNIGEMGAQALHVMVELALLREQNPEARCAVQQLAEKLQASVHTLQKVARRLVMENLADGVRGANGGLRLARDPATITMLQIIEAVEGRICSNNCMFAKRVCPAGCGCVFEGVTGGMEKMVREYFTKTTLADLCAGVAKKTH